MRISDWSSDVCSSDLARAHRRDRRGGEGAATARARQARGAHPAGGAGADDHGCLNNRQSRHSLPRPLPPRGRGDEEQMTTTTNASSSLAHIGERTHINHMARYKKLIMAGDKTAAVM